MKSESFMHKKSRSISSLTFIEQPSVLVSNLSSRSQSRSEIEMANSNNSSHLMEIQRLKSELTNIVQSASNKQDLELRQLINQLSQVQLDLKPKIISLESQQNLSQNKISDLNQQIEKASTEDINSLKKQYDQLNDKFDNFISIDVERKIDPISDDIRQAHSKVDRLSIESDLSIKHLSEGVKEIAEKINMLMNVQSNNNLSYESLNEIIPSINFLEMHMHQIKQLYTYLKFNSRNPQVIIQHNENNMNSMQIEELNRNFNKSVKDLRSYCTKNTSELQINILNLKKENDHFDSMKKESEQNLDSQLKFLDQIRNRVDNLDRIYNARFNSLNRNTNSAINALKSSLSNLQSQTNKSTNGYEDKSPNVITNNINTRINEIIQKINNSIEKSKKENQYAQQEASNEEMLIRSQIEGDGTPLIRLKELEDQILWCINTINNVNQHRAEMYKNGSGNLFIIKQIENLEKRLEIAEEKLKKIDGKNPPMKPRLIPTEESILPPPQQATTTNIVRPHKNRKLPNIPEKFFPDDEGNNPGNI